MVVRDVMSTGMVTANRADSVRAVVFRMITRHCGAIPVIDDEARLIGIVTARDLMIPLYPNYGDYIHDSVHSRDFVEMENGYPAVLEKNVEDIMTPNPLSVSPDDPALKAASYMGLRHLRRMPVVENGKLVGMISLGDISRGLFFFHHR
jgi:CBS domain-containing protein